MEWRVSGTESVGWIEYRGISSEYREVSILVEDPDAYLSRWR